jgi:alginate O-acetyltransferase complex protein AlgJ
LIAIAPDKSSAHPELLPDDFAGRKCMEERKDAFWSSLLSRADVEVIDPRPALSTFESEAGERVWRPNDTHWGPAGAAVFSKTVAEAIEPALAETSRITAGPVVDLPGDLSQMLGDLKQDPTPTARIERDGVTLRVEGREISQNEVPDLEYGPVTVTATSSDVPMIPGKTLLLGDSFFEASRLQFPAYYSSLTYIHNMSAEVPGAADAVGALLAESDTLIFEMVERSAAGGHVAFLKDDAIDTLIEAMEANPRG